jgi:hypothetical protein
LITHRSGDQMPASSLKLAAGAAAKAARLISRRAFILGSVAPLLLRALPAVAQESCGAETNIIALADYVLANRSKLPKLQQRRYGSLSAYLKIRYQRFTAPEQVDSLVGPLVTARVDRARELFISWRISILGLESMLAAATPEAEKDLLDHTAGLSMLRAAVISGEIPFLFDKIAALPEEGRGKLEFNLVEALIDIDDTSAMEISAEAMARGLLVIAGGLVATHSDHDGWLKFLAQVPDKAKADALVTLLVWLPALRGKPPLPRPPAADAQGEMGRALIHQSIIAAAHTPERDFLMTYFNQSADFAGTGAAATMINELTRDGTLIDMETAWLVVYEALKEAAPSKETVESQLAAIPFSGTRFSGTNVREALDTMLAIEAFKGAAAGSGTPPEMVEGTSKDFVVQLPAWREAAQAIGQGADLTPFRSSGQKLGIVTNLLFAIGKFVDLANFLTSTVPNSDSIRLAEIYAEALDRRCGGTLAFPAEAVTMPMTPLFRFEA